MSSRLDGWREEETSEGEIPEYVSSLLDAISEPAIFVDTLRSQIIDINNACRKLSGWTRKDISRGHLHDLVHGLAEKHLIAGDACDVIVLNHAHEEIDVTLTVFRVDPIGQWLIYKIHPKLTQPKRDMTAHAVIESIDSIYKLLDESGINWSSVAHLMSELFHSEIAAIYMASGSHPDLQLVGVYSVDGYAFPESLPASDLIRLSDFHLWTPESRVLTELHRHCRSIGLTQVLSAPVKEDSATFGMIVIAGRQWDIAEEDVRLIGILSTMVSRAIKPLGKSLSEVKSMLGEHPIMTMLPGIVANMHEGVIVATPKLEVMGMNPAAEWMLSYSTSEVAAVPVESILVGSSGLLSALESAQQGIEIPSLGPLTIHRRDGQEFVVQTQIVPVKLDDEVQAIIIFLMDISENEEIRAKAQHLEQRAAMGDFTAVFAHDMRNPINSIKSALDLVSSCLPEDDANQEALKGALGDVDRLTHYVESVLAFVRPLEPKLEVVEFDGFIRRIFQRWHPRFSAAHVAATFSCDENIPRVKIDQRSFERVVTNLFGNAIEAMQRTESPCLGVRISLVQDEGDTPVVQLAISDNGAGIPEDIKPKLFTSFVTSNKVSGTGLGLAITKRIVTANRGSITFDSIPGGTVFFIRLPIHTEEG